MTHKNYVICAECDYYRHNEGITSRIEHACLSDGMDFVTGEIKELSCRKKNKKGDCVEFKPKENI